MNVTVLHTEDCPNLEPLMAELHDLLDDRSDAVVTTTLVRTNDEAKRLGFHGSPTILIDGHDPFPASPEPVGLSCRQYPCCRDAAGHAAGFPTRTRLAEVLRASG
ncbi:MAG TPA: thioredoxin family protein [Acidimicrobiales bacterium]|nr:thioredoxin family protein [Acidimicrobiales bacterium]